MCDSFSPNLPPTAPGGNLILSLFLLPFAPTHEDSAGRASKRDHWPTTTTAAKALALGSEIHSFLQSVSRLSSRIEKRIVLRRLPSQSRGRVCSILSSRQQKQNLSHFHTGGEIILINWFSYACISVLVFWLLNLRTWKETRIDFDWSTRRAASGETCLIKVCSSHRAHTTVAVASTAATTATTKI